MADARDSRNDGNKLMYTLQPFLDSQHETDKSEYDNEMFNFDTDFAWQDRSKGSYTTQIAQSTHSFSEQDEDEIPSCRHRFDRQSSIVDGLLSEIYDRWHDHKHDSFDSDTFTECSSTSEVMHWRSRSYFHDIEIGGRQMGRLHPALLQEYSITELRNLVGIMTRYVNQMSARLVRQLKRRERRMSKVQNNCDIVTAIIQASSPKRQNRMSGSIRTTTLMKPSRQGIDTRMRFTVEPCQGESAFDQWKDAMKAVARLPLGIPDEFRKKVWLSLADQHIHELKIDWDKTVKVAFNERSNPDDNKLGLQIVKDLHRTGCSGFSGEDNEEERALLKRILLAYARWNKTVGYCQGFNVIAALLLDVMDRKEADAFKVMIYLIDHVLPQSYFANNLRALSVDMAVFRDLLKVFPKLSKHLDYLQHAQDQMSGGCYEPPLTNVFTMQWFLTLFATCLPKATTLRVWDAIMLDGSEILLRTALVIWGKLSSRILTVSSADEFYTLMGDITQEMLEGKVLDADSMIKSIYSIAPFPFPQLTDLREKYTYNIRPFTPASKRSWAEPGGVLPSDEDELEDEDIEAITCFTGFIPVNAAAGARPKALEGDQRTGSIPDISSLGPGAYGLGPLEGGSGGGLANTPAYMERMTTDISALKKQYVKLRQRQRQAHIIQTTASAKQQALKLSPIVPAIETPRAMNHLFVNKQGVKAGRNRLVAAGPRIANLYPVTGIAGSTQTAVQPGAPQALGNAKCKWAQKSSKQDQKRNSTSRLNSVTSEGSDLEKHENNNNSVTQSMYESQAGDKSICQSGEAFENDKLVDDSGIVLSPEKVSESSRTEDQVSEKLDCSDDGRVGCESTDIHVDSERMRYAADDSGSVEESNDRLTELSSVSQGQLVCSDAESSHVESDIEVQYTATTADKGNRSETEGDTPTTVDKGNSSETEGDVPSPDSVGATVTESNASDSNVPESEKTVDKNEEHLESKASECNNVFSGKGALEENEVTEETTRKLPAECGENENLTVDVTDSKVQEHPTEKGSACATEKKDSEIPRKGKALKSEKTLKAASRNGSSGKTSHSSVASATHSKSFEQYYNTKRNLATNPSQSVESSQKKFSTPKKAFNPFPVLHVNQNRAKTGIKLGLYKQSTLEEFEKNLKTQTVWGK